jgi:tryptophanyl-tRNA synthetase
MGCKECKQQIAEQINGLLEPMRERRRILKHKPKAIDDILLTGTEQTRAVAQETMLEVREAMKINYFS